MKKYVYFISIACHHHNGLVGFKSIQYISKDEFTDISQIHNAENEIKDFLLQENNFYPHLLFVTIINYKLLRTEEINE